MCLVQLHNHRTKKNKREINNNRVNLDLLDRWIEQSDYTGQRAGINFKEQMSELRSTDIAMRALGIMVASKSIL